MAVLLAAKLHNSMQPRELVFCSNISLSVFWAWPRASQNVFLHRTPLTALALRYLLLLLRFYCALTWGLDDFLSGLRNISHLFAAICAMEKLLLWPSLPKRLFVVTPVDSVILVSVVVFCSRYFEQGFIFLFSIGIREVNFKTPVSFLSLNFRKPMAFFSLALCL